MISLDSLMFNQSVASYWVFCSFGYHAQFESDEEL
jgi:hypothetical protein